MCGKNDPTATAGWLTDTFHVKTVHWNRALWLKMRWSVTADARVCAHRHTQQTHRRWGMEGVKRWIVQVMHSLRLLSLVSHTMAPMHSLSTLSHVKNKKKKKDTNTSSSCSVRRVRREENGEGCCCLDSERPQRVKGQTVDVVCRC